ncbi:shikimate dehydrogenase [Lishizhenia tianjinensis]|uniref:Shikimate dehydrogenase n=1 Tax=Lishizhenia tianjinensis TaxID=477690 RepID=A0A1I6Y086_9FLAO|nr:shikimate dehydrogenase [Lishizhenia tianjinensis]SFT43836.1 shikimate dehydrogenase [Lishizhenia tianjinensis]
MKNYGLIGRTLKHSFSKDFFTEKFIKENTEAEYHNFEISDIKDVKEILKRGDLHGLNVTIPYKEAILPFLDEVSEEAKQIGAVNAIAFQNGKTIGHNTDAYGFARSIKPFLKNTHHRALILGTGGASKAVAHVLENIGLDVLFVSRDPKNEEHFSYSAINSFMVQACGLIVNTTPVGMYPNVDEMPDFPVEYLTPDHLVVDLIYNPEKTKFLEEAEKNGAEILNGLSMLKEQALKAYELWNNN